MRQAFLIAARDELGLGTRDSILREDFPAKPDLQCASFEMFCGVTRAQKDFDLDYALKLVGSKDNSIWQWKLNVAVSDPATITTLAEKAEALSRGELKDVLTRAGRKRAVRTARAAGVVPGAVHDLLWSWNEISVLAGLRHVHAEIREKGESPELLAALAIGYANLGSLTEYHYSAAHKAYYARSLLYAERLVHKTDASPWSRWHRAYARMLVGLHNLAADDVAAAKKMQGDSSHAKSLPFWTEVLEAFGQGDLSRMSRGAKTSQERRLAHYLKMQAVVFAELGDMAIDAVSEFSRECPDCARCYDILVTSGQLGPSHEGAYQAISNTSAFLRKRLADVPGLPAPTLTQVADSEGAADNAAEIAFRKMLAANLKQAGVPQLDRGEPSLSALGHMIEEIEFAQVLRRLEFEAYMFGVPTDVSVEELSPFCAGHRYAAYLARYQQSKEAREKGAAELAKRIEPWDLTFKERPLLQWLNAVAPSPNVQAWYQVVTDHGDTIFGDLMRDLRGGFAGDPDDSRNASYMAKLSKTSDKLPAAVAQLVKRDWARIERDAVALEAAYADDPLVTKAFANRYYRLKRYDDAERCAKRLVDVHPGYQESRLLANIYKAKKDFVHWKETLDKSRNLPAHGLEQAQVENSIALELLKRKEFKEAVVYADSAAESYSEWSLRTAARAHEMLGEWKKSEQFIRAATERYEGSMMSWLKWCVRTNHGDRQAAEEFARSKYEAMGTSLYNTQYRNIGHFYLLTDEPEKALLLYQRAYEKGHDGFEGFHAATVADSLGKTALRDQILQQIIDSKLKRAGARPNFFGRLAEQFRQTLPPQVAKPLNLAEVDKILADAATSTSQSPSVLPYFVGVFLKNRGDLKTAQIYLIRCAHSDDWQQINHVLACQLLRKMKVTVPPEEEAPKRTEPPKAPARTRPQRRGVINRSSAKADAIELSRPGNVSRLVDWRVV